MGFDSTIRIKQLNQGDLSGFVTPMINSGIAATGKLTGSFYPRNSNPSFYITSGQTGVFKTQADLDIAYYSTLSYVSTNFYPNSNPNNYLSANNGQFFLTTGNQTISGITTFVNYNTNTTLPTILVSGDTHADLQRTTKINYRRINISDSGSNVYPFVGGLANLEVDSSNYGHLFLQSVDGGSVRLSSNAGGYGAFGGDVTAANFYAGLSKIAGDGTSSCIVGSLGVGITNPIYSFDISGDIGNSSNSNDNHITLDDGYGNFSLWSNGQQLITLTNHTGISIGFGAAAVGKNSIALGTQAYTNGINTIVIGSGAYSTSSNVIILGNGQKIGINNSSPSCDLDVNGSGHFASGLIVEKSFILSGNAPATSTSSGIKGQIAVSGIYLFVATGTNQWGRVALSTY